MFRAIQLIGKLGKKKKKWCSRPKFASLHILKYRTLVTIFIPCEDTKTSNPRFWQVKAFASWLIFFKAQLWSATPFKKACGTRTRHSVTSNLFKKNFILLGKRPQSSWVWDRQTLSSRKTVTWGNNLLTHPIVYCLSSSLALKASNSFKHLCQTNGPVPHTLFTLSTHYVWWWCISYPYHTT